MPEKELISTKNILKIGPTIFLQDFFPFRIIFAGKQNS